MRLVRYLLALVFLGALSAMGLFTYISLQTSSYVYEKVDSVPHAQAALVLGASVFGDGTLSVVLKDRADMAAELYYAKKVDKILVTGDDSDVSHNEVDPVGKYLFSLGIPKEDIFLDHAGFDTYSSMYRARDVFGVSSLAIVSQQFHLPRAVFIARHLGLEASGVAAQSGDKFLYNYMREVPASVKAAYDLLFERLPKYLGPQFSITGNGMETWIVATSTPTTTPQ